MGEIAKDLLLAVLWIAVLNKAIQLWRAPEELPLRSATAGLLGAAIGLTLPQEPIAGLVDGAAIGLSRLLLNLATAAGFAGMLGFFTHSLHESHHARKLMRRHLIVVTTLLAVAVLAWLVMPLDVREQPATPSTVGHWSSTVFLGAITLSWIYSVAGCLRPALRAARTATIPRMRRGLAILSVGILGFSGSCLCTISLIAAGWVLPPTSPVWTVLQKAYLIAMLVGASGLAAGLAYPVVAAMRTVLPQWRRHWNDYRAMSPLWKALHAEWPQLRLAQRIAGVHRLRYRRAVEILDGLVRLGPYYPRPGNPDADVAEQAAQIRAALASKHAGISGARAPHPVPHSGSSSIDADIQWLARLGRAFATTQQRESAGL